MRSREDIAEFSVGPMPIGTTRRHVAVGRQRLWHRIFSALASLSIFCALWSLPPRLATSATLEEQVAAHFRAGQQALKLGQFVRAVEEFKKVLALDPDLVEARANLGLAYYLSGDYDLAVTELARVLRERPNLVAANLFLGLSYLKLGQPEKAIPRLEEASRADPSNREARRALASGHLARDDYRAAAKEFRVLFSQQTDKAEAWYQLGRDYLQLSTRLAARMATAYRDTAWAHQLAGNVLALRDLWNDAASEYRQALEAGPHQVGLQASLGTAFLRLRKLAEAEAAFLAELQLDANNEQALLGLAELSVARGDTEAALRWIEKLSDGAPDFFRALRELPTVGISPQQANSLIDGLQATPASRPTHFLLAILYSAAGQPQKAEEQFELFHRSQEPDSVRLKRVVGGGAAEQHCRARRYAICAELLHSKSRLQDADYLMLGKARLGLGEYEMAADAFAGALAIDKDNVEAVYWLVQTYQRLAEGCFRRLEELFPHSWRVHQLRAEAHKLRQVYNDAIEEYRLALSLRPDEPELYEGLGHAYLLKNSYGEAEVALEKALELDPSRARALFLLGRLYVNQRQEHKAIPYLQKALRREPDLLEARASLGTAYRRLGQAALALPQLEMAAPQDFYGDLHYQLFLAYRQLGKEELARQALARSQELRRSSVARHQARVAGVIEIEGD